MAKTGTSAVLKCPQCRQPLPDGSRFCLVCGAPVGRPGTTTGRKAQARRPHRPRGRVAKTEGETAPAEGEVGPSPATGSHRSLLTLGLLAILIGGIVLAAYGLVAAAGEGGEETSGVRPLARAGLGADTHEAPPAPDAGNATTDVIRPGEDARPGITDSGGQEGSGNPATTGPASPAQALAAAFGLAEGETVVACSAADFDDVLCYVPHLMNLEQGRYVYQVGPPFSEPVAWALVEQQGDGTFQTTQTADFNFEDEATPPFSPGGTMAGVTFTSELLDDRPTDRLDDGGSAPVAGATEIFVFVRYTGLTPSDEATITLELDGSPIGEPSAIDIDPSGDGWATLRIAQGDASELPVGTYTVAVALNGLTIAQGSMAILAT